VNKAYLHTGRKVLDAHSQVESHFAICGLAESEEDDALGCHYLPTFWDISIILYIKLKKPLLAGIHFVVPHFFPCQ
jgi:hypothetical protein